MFFGKFWLGVVKKSKGGTLGSESGPLSTKLDLTNPCIIRFPCFLVVWAGSSELGIARAYSNGNLYIVANYNPGGNMQGDFAENVLPPVE